MLEYSWNKWKGIGWKDDNTINNIINNITVSIPILNSYLDLQNNNSLLIFNVISFNYSYNLICQFW